jgi:hypothetical protein
VYVLSPLFIEFHKLKMPTTVHDLSCWFFFPTVSTVVGSTVFDFVMADGLF